MSRRSSWSVSAGNARRPLLVNSQHQAFYQPVALTHSGAPTPEEEDNGASETYIHRRDEGRLGTTSVTMFLQVGQLSLTDAENNRSWVCFALASCSGHDLQSRSLCLLHSHRSTVSPFRETRPCSPLPGRGPLVCALIRIRCPLVGC